MLFCESIKSLFKPVFSLIISGKVKVEKDKVAMKTHGGVEV
jgi:hypothetical protein